MNRWVIGLVTFWAVTTGQAEFKQVKLDYEGEELVGSVWSLDPLVAEFSTRKDGVFIRMLWVDRGEGFEQIYNNQTGVVGPATVLGEDTGDFDIAGNNQGDVFFVHRLKTDLGNRGEGVIFRLGENGFEEFAPPATQRLGNGANGKFYYAFPEVADNGTVAMIGYDDRFPHFVLRVSGDEIDVIAQESVTAVPDGGGQFSRFGTDMHLSPDGSRIVFRGERADGVSGIYSWTEAGITTIADSSMKIPGRTESFTQFFNQSNQSFLGNDGAVYILNFDPRSLVVYRDGSLETLLTDGDMVEGEAVAQLSNIQQAPNGELFVQDVRGFLRYRNGAWENFQVLSEFEAPDGKRLSGAYRVGEAGVYVAGSIFVREELRSYASLYLRGYDSEEYTRILDFDAETFGDPSAAVPQLIVGDQVLFRNQTGIYIGNVADLSRDAGSSPATPGAPSPSPEPEPEPEPEPSLNGLETVLASLPEGVREAGADADGDGISNLLEYILGLPLEMASSTANVLDVDVQAGVDLGLEGDSGSYLTLQVRTRAALDGINVRVVMSTAIEQLAAQGQDAIQVGSAVEEGDFESRVFRSPVAIEDAPVGFIGLVAEVTP